MAAVLGQIRVGHPLASHWFAAELALQTAHRGRPACVGLATYRPTLGRATSYGIKTSLHRLSQGVRRIQSTV